MTKTLEGNTEEPSLYKSTHNSYFSSKQLIHFTALNPSKFKLHYISPEQFTTCCEVHLYAILKVVFLSLPVQLVPESLECHGDRELSAVCLQSRWRAQAGLPRNGQPKVRPVASDYWASWLEAEWLVPTFRAKEEKPVGFQRTALAGMLTIPFRPSGISF